MQPLQHSKFVLFVSDKTYSREDGGEVLQLQGPRVPVAATTRQVGAVAASSIWGRLEVDM